MSIFELVKKDIKPLDKEAMEATITRIDKLIKPIGSLGKLEDLAIQLAGITGSVQNQFLKKCMVVMSADNGIVEEGVTCTPQFVTQWQTINMTKGICGINVLSRHAGMDVKIVDIGINADIDNSKILDRKVRKGTSNMAKGPAMSKLEAVEAIEVGIELVRELVESGYQIIGTGEMGIGNTSTSSAILMSFSGLSSDLVVGKGAGLTEEDFTNKKSVIEKVLEINKPQKEDPLDVLSKVGGFDIAGLVGCYLGAAYYRIPIIIDGFISAAAALVAYKINSITREYMIPSHNSAEPGFKWMMKEIGLSPILDLNMRLGEGTGCPLVFNIIEAATKIVAEMATFEEAELKEDFLVDIR
ncbi:MAG: nicotinate-nucleotide--dimethylbenzimidazole phosphoribosyltransferase [Clostridiaceae bacterium]|nr:nicotinate-nucleotide--dimethylbenzimidazole phosphoribosyltransferase [Clostridiaceae bacterium]